MGWQHADASEAVLPLDFGPLQRQDLRDRLRRSQCWSGRLYQGKNGQFLKELWTNISVFPHKDDEVT